MTLDFTYRKYEALLKCIGDSEYVPTTVGDYIRNAKGSEAGNDKSGRSGKRPIVILRHDVDLDPHQQVQYARLEHEHDIKASYYFRSHEGILVEDIIDSIASQGHEIGYHYETLTKARGDMDQAVELFEKEFSFFRGRWGSHTVCPHGGAYVEGVNLYNLKDLIRVLPKMVRKEEIFSRWKNDTVIEHLDLDDLGITGDAHVTVDFSDVFYLSDSGRSWENRHKRLDKVADSHPLRDRIRSTDDIMELIRKGSIDTLYLTIHFEQWKDSFPGWLSWYLSQLIRRKGKRIIHGSS